MHIKNQFLLNKIVPIAINVFKQKHCMNLSQSKVLIIKYCINIAEKVIPSFTQINLAQQY